jgi:hypothetical protein
VSRRLQNANANVIIFGVNLRSPGKLLESEEFRLRAKQAFVTGLCHDPQFADRPELIEIGADGQLLASPPPAF